MPTYNGGEMPTTAKSYAVDTSVAVAALDSAHAAHAGSLAAVRAHRPALAGHAAFETISVLTRMPGHLAVAAPTAVAIIERVFPEIHWLTPKNALALLARLGPVGITGGAVYDALVGEAARTARCILLTRDERARRTYDLIGVDYRIVPA